MVSIYLSVGLPLGLTPSNSMSNTVLVIWLSSLRLTCPCQRLPLLHQVCCYWLNCCGFPDLFIYVVVSQHNVFYPTQPSHLCCGLSA